MKVGAARLIWMHAGEERRGGAGVIAGTIAKRAPVDLSQPAEHVDVFAVRLQRLHRGAELEILPCRFGRPHERPRALVRRADDAVRRVDVAQADRGLGRSEGRERRHHRIQQRQGHGCANASQKCPPGQSLV